jgi:hypothetical protein
MNAFNERHDVFCDLIYQELSKQKLPKLLCGYDDDYADMFKSFSCRMAYSGFVQGEEPQSIAKKVTEEFTDARCYGFHTNDPLDARDNCGCALRNKNANIQYLTEVLNTIKSLFVEK